MRIQAAVIPLLLAACGSPPVMGGVPADYRAPGGTSDSGAGLPCDVARLLRTNCSTCHSRPPTGGAPQALLTRDDLLAPSPSEPGKTNALASLERMQSAARPMPPSGLLPASDVGAFSAWVGAGTPAGTCGADGGTTDPPAQCTSGSYWRGGENANMAPGRACIACHAQEDEGPRYTIAGTLYPTLHEPNDCNGTPAATVVVTDANGQTYTLRPAASGNFAYRGAMRFPVRVKVTSGTAERPMIAQLAASPVDCNACHTQYGTQGAPGRIRVP